MQRSVDKVSTRHARVRALRSRSCREADGRVIVEGTIMKRAHTLAFWMAIPLLSAQTPTQATLHIYRRRLSVGTAAHPTVFCDMFPVIRTQNGRDYTMKVSAGRHSFTTADNPHGIQVDVEPGKEYFVRIDFSPNSTFAKGATPMLVPPELGRMETLKLRPLDGQYIEDATCGRP
jgi:hypothetical protein